MEETETRCHDTPSREKDRQENNAESNGRECGIPPILFPPTPWYIHSLISNSDRQIEFGLSSSMRWCRVRQRLCLVVATAALRARTREGVHIYMICPVGSPSVLMLFCTTCVAPPSGPAKRTRKSQDDVPKSVRVPRLQEISSRGSPSPVDSVVRSLVLNPCTAHQDESTRNHEWNTQ